MTFDDVRLGHVRLTEFVDGVAHGDIVPANPEERRWIEGAYAVAVFNDLEFLGMELREDHGMYGRLTALEGVPLFGPMKFPTWELTAEQAYKYFLAAKVKQATFGYYVPVWRTM